MSSLSTPIIKKEQRRTSALTAADTFHENDDVDVETGILAGSEDGALPLQDQQRKRRRRYGWYIVGVIGLLFIIGVAVSVPRNNNNTTNDNDASSTTNNAADDVSLTAADVEASSSSDTTTVVIEPTIITEEEQQPPATLEIVNDVPSSSFEGTNEGDVVLDDNTDSAAAVVPSDDKDDTINEPVYTWNPNDISSSNDISSDATAAAEDETEEEEEQALPAATVDDEEEVEDYLPLFEPEVTIGDAALLNNDIITTSSPTTLSPTTTSPTTMKPTPLATKSPVTLKPTPLPSSMPSKVPTNQPTNPPSPPPSNLPTSQPSTKAILDVSGWNVLEPTPPPTPKPVFDVSGWNVLEPTPPPTPKPVFDMNSWNSQLVVTPPPSPPPTTRSPTSPPTTASPTKSPIKANPYYFGEEFVTVPSLGIEMSTGLSVKLIALTGQKVTYANGETSKDSWHTRSDAAGILVLDPANPTTGGYVYMSNSEESDGNGGVFGLYFDADGNILEYKPILTGTTDNCGGGLTPWNTYITCEETGGGQCWQVGADGRTEETNLGGKDGGWYESVAVDPRVYDAPVFFTTEDVEDGALRRFVATQHGWDAVHSDGEETFLNLFDDGTFEWTEDEDVGKASAKKFFPNTEGIQVHEGKVYFMSKEKQILIILDLENYTWTSEGTGKKFYGEGSFNGQPDQNVFGPTRNYIYFTEDGSNDPGVYARYGTDGTYFTLFQAIAGGIHTNDETIGIALSPDHRRFYAGFQSNGFIFEFTRIDGFAFE